MAKGVRIGAPCFPREEVSGCESSCRRCDASMKKNWQWVFPQHLRWRNSETGEQERLHLDPSLVQKAIRRAMRAAEINKAATSHCFRHS